MQYVFIINPTSGANMPKDFIEKEINALKDKYDILVHYTIAPNEATSFIKDFLKNNDGEYYIDVKKFYGGSCCSEWGIKWNYSTLLR
mgnify:CR=1 FL=1